MHVEARVAARPGEVPQLPLLHSLHHAIIPWLARVRRAIVRKKRGPGEEEKGRRDKGGTRETESEDDGLDVDMDDDELEEPEHGHEVDAPSEPEVKESAPVPVHSKDTEKQLSKKELKQKQLTELDAVLAELGISKNVTLADVTTKSERKPDGQNGDGDKNGLPTPSESKTSKKKKSWKGEPSKYSKEQSNLQ